MIQRGNDYDGDGGSEPPVAWSSSGGFAYVPGRVLVRGTDAAEHLDAITGRDNLRQGLGLRPDAPDAAWIRVDGVDDAVAVAGLLRADGYAAQPDHAFFAHGADSGGCCCGPHPALTFDNWGPDHPFAATPFRGNAMAATPFRGNPFRGNPSQTSSALPADDRSFGPVALATAATPPRITVLDTGLAEGAQCPPLLADPRFAGDVDLPDAPADGWLDPVAGHGTFIAGLIEQLAPGCDVRVVKVVSPLGVAVESDVLTALLELAWLDPAERPDIVSMSFGGTALAMAPALRSAVAFAQLRGVVLVASAGNDGSCEPQYPAAYDGVIGVGALGPDGPAPWTNWGAWVDACAPGTDLVSAFFADFDGAAPEVNGYDPDRFTGWARWSGTSFAAPVVVAALARQMVLGGVGAADAVERVVHQPAALRIRGLGTVVGTA